MPSELSTLSRPDYLRFFQGILVHSEQDFPRRLIERECCARIQPLQLLMLGHVARWAAVAAALYECTRDPGYLTRANRLLAALTAAVKYTPQAVWDYFPYQTPAGMASAREAFEGVPREACWHGHPWWHMGGFSNALPLRVAATGGPPRRWRREHRHAGARATALGPRTRYRRRMR